MRAMFAGDPDTAKRVAGAVALHGLLGDSIEALGWCCEHDDRQMIDTELAIMALCGQMLHANAEGRWADAETHAAEALRLSRLQKLRHAAHHQSPN